MSNENNHSVSPAVMALKLFACYAGLVIAVVVLIGTWPAIGKSLPFGGHNAPGEARMHTVQDLNSGQPGAIDSPGGEATGPVLQL